MFCCRWVISSGVVCAKADLIAADNARLTSSSVNLAPSTMLCVHKKTIFVGTRHTKTIYQWQNYEKEMGFKHFKQVQTPQRVQDDLDLFNCLLVATMLCVL